MEQAWYGEKWSDGSVLWRPWNEEFYGIRERAQGQYYPCYNDPMYGWCPYADEPTCETFPEAKAFIVRWTPEAWSNRGEKQ